MKNQIQKPSKLSKNLTLTGMMGVGKSTIGKNLAKRLKYNFFDIDDLIETKEGISINLIFKNKSEKYFRKIENNYITKRNKDVTKVIVKGKYEEWKHYGEWYNTCLIETINELDILDTNNNVKISYTCWVMIISDLLNTLENKTIDFINKKYNNLSNNNTSVKVIKKLKLFTNCIS